MMHPWTTMLAEAAPPVSVSSAVTGPSFSEALVRMAVTLVTVVVLLVLAARFGPRMFGRLRSGVLGASRREESELIRVISSRAMSPSQSLVVVEVDGRRLLLSIGSASTTLVCELGLPHAALASTQDQPSDSPPDAAAASRFSELLKSKRLALQTKDEAGPSR